MKMMLLVFVVFYILINFQYQQFTSLTYLGGQPETNCDGYLFKEMDNFLDSDGESVYPKTGWIMESYFPLFSKRRDSTVPLFS